MMFVTVHNDLREDMNRACLLIILTPKITSFSSNKPNQYNLFAQNHELQNTSGTAAILCHTGIFVLDLKKSARHIFLGKFEKFVNSELKLRFKIYLKMPSKRFSNATVFIPILSDINEVL